MNEWNFVMERLEQGILTVLSALTGSPEAGRATWEMLQNCWQTYPAVVAVAALGVLLSLLLFLVLLWREVRLQWAKREQRRIGQSLLKLTQIYTEIQELDKDRNIAISYQVQEGKLRQQRISIPTTAELLEGVPEEDKEQFRDNSWETIIERVLKTYAQEEYFYRQKSADGKYHWFSMVAQGFRLKEHQRRCMLLKRNVDETRSANLRQVEELRQGLENVQKESADKSTYISGMAHEVSTLIAGMSVALEQAQTAAAPAQREEALSNAQVSAKHLQDMVEDVLKVALLEHGKVELHNETFSLKEVIKELGHLYYAQALAKQLTFRLELEGFKEDYVIGDKLRVRQVLNNFLSNAFKFTAAGGTVTCVVRQLEIRNKRVRMQFIIRDTGLGIAKENLEKIFEPFEKGGRVIGENYTGSGLGLSITKDLTDMMEGTIEVASETGKGSTFTVTIPFGFDTVKHEEAGQNYNFDYRALLVTADPAEGAKLCQELDKLGFTSLVVDGLEQTLEALQTAEEHDEAFDYCFLSLDGKTEAVTSLAQDIQAASLVKKQVVVLSGTESVEQLHKLQGEASLRVLYKPVFRSDIVALAQG